MLYVHGCLKENVGGGGIQIETICCYLREVCEECTSGIIRSGSMLCSGERNLWCDTFVNIF